MVALDAVMTLSLGFGGKFYVIDRVFVGSLGCVI